MYDVWETKRGFNNRNIRDGTGCRVDTGYTLSYWPLVISTQFFAVSSSNFYPKLAAKEIISLLYLLTWVIKRGNTIPDEGRTPLGWLSAWITNESTLFRHVTRLAALLGSNSYKLVSRTNISRYWTRHRPVSCKIDWQVVDMRFIRL